MADRYTYPVELEHDKKSGTITVSFVDVPGATEGDDRDEAMVNAVACLETALTEYVARRQPLPKPSRPKRGQAMVRLSALGVAKAALYEGMQARVVGRAELARRLGWHLAQIDRILDLAHDSKMDLVEQALAALDMRLRIEVEAA